MGLHLYHVLPKQSEETSERGERAEGEVCVVVTGRSQGAGIGLELGYSGNSRGCGLVTLHRDRLPRPLRQGLPRLRKY